MIRMFSVTVLVVASTFAMQSAWSECTAVRDASQSAAPLELSSPPGGLRLFNDATRVQNNAPREYRFSGTRFFQSAAAPSPVDKEMKFQVRGVPAKWGTRLVSDITSPATVFSLESSKIDGSIIDGSQYTLGGLVRTPGSEHDWTAFLNPAQPSEELTAYEYLYVLVLRADTGGLFAFKMFDWCSQPLDQATYSQSDLLHEIARRRNALAARLNGNGIFQPWVVVTLRPVALSRPLQPDEVTALVEDPQGPVAHAQVIFSRSPHSGCSATSDESGIAACILQDNHGADGDDESGPVVATFAGEFSSSRTAPPMATIVQDPPAPPKSQAR